MRNANNYGLPSINELKQKHDDDHAYPKVSLYTNDTKIDARLAKNFKAAVVALRSRLRKSTAYAST